MNYTHLTTERKVAILTLSKDGNSIRTISKKLAIPKSTVHRIVKSGLTARKKWSLDINKKYNVFLDYLRKHFDWKCKSIDVCVNTFQKYHKFENSVSTKEVYNWLNSGKLDLGRLCYKKHKRNRKWNMMTHFKWNINNKTVLPIAVRPKYIELRKEYGHLEIDSIVGKRNETSSIISIVDRTTRKMWLIEAHYKNEYYINNLIYNFIIKNDIQVKSITTDNGLEFQALGITAKKLGVKLYKCDPYCSFQRGTNERYNALVRRFIPKGTSMKFMSQQRLDSIAMIFNSMPRRMFNFATPNEIDYNLWKCPI